jgi:hypothetical protein
MLSSFSSGIIILDGRKRLWLCCFLEGYPREQCRMLLYLNCINLENMVSLNGWLLEHSYWPWDSTWFTDFHWHCCLWWLPKVEVQINVPLHNPKFLVTGSGSCLKFKVYLHVDSYVVFGVVWLVMTEVASLLFFRQVAKLACGVNVLFVWPQRVDM